MRGLMCSAVRAVCVAARWCGVGCTQVHARSGLRVACLCLALCAAAPALADVPPDDGFDFVTIGDTGNIAYEGGLGGTYAGRGSVNYEYRMATLEVSAAQWLEFINIFSPQIGTPFWGQLNIIAPIQPAWPSTNQFVLTGSASEVGQYPMLGITWREAAMYVNWLNNDKATDLWAIMDGAYDVSTFGYAAKHRLHRPGCASPRCEVLDPHPR
jgi:hypothetical protein